MMKGLRLDISMDRRDSFDGMEDTYRREGLTVGSDYMRIHGVDFNVNAAEVLTINSVAVSDSSEEYSSLKSVIIFTDTDKQMEVTYPDLIMGRRIGQGACSSVNMARHSETGEMFAVKMFNVYDEVCFATMNVMICWNWLSYTFSFPDDET